VREGLAARQFYKIRGVYAEHERYGPQIDLQNIRLVTDADREDGFDPAAFVEHSRFDAGAMFAELKALVQENIADAPLRRLVLTILDRHADALKKLPATLRNFHPFAGGLLEHTLSVTTAVSTWSRSTPPITRTWQPPLNQDLVVAGAALHPTSAASWSSATPPSRRSRRWTAA